MKLYLKNKIISIGDGSKVLDEEGESAFYVKGKIITFTKKKKIYDAEKNLIYKVRTKFWHLLKKSAYIMDPKGHIIMQLREKHSILGKGFDVLRSEDAYNIVWGGFAKGINEIYKDDELICTIKRKILSLVDSFELTYDNPDEAGLFVAMTIAMDCVYDSDDD